MATTKKVKLGPNASIFHDQTTGITICKGETKELNAYQLSSKRIKNALSGGHLIYSNDVIDEFDKEEERKATIEKLTSKTQKLIEKGVEPEKAAEAFTLDEIKLLANSRDIDVEQDDTKGEIMRVIFEDFDSNSGKKPKK